MGACWYKDSQLVRKQKAFTCFVASFSFILIFKPSSSSSSSCSSDNQFDFCELFFPPNSSIIFSHLKKKKNHDKCLSWQMSGGKENWAELFKHF